MSKTACIIPWSNVAIWPDGRANFCCEIVTPLTVDGRMGSLYRDSLDDLWNASEIVQVPAAMARGEKPETCRPCWEREAAGGVSRRLLANAGYRQLGGRLAVEALPLEGAGRTGSSWSSATSATRSAAVAARSSARIAADPVHNAWNANQQAPASETTSARRLQRVPEKQTFAYPAGSQPESPGCFGQSRASVMGLREHAG